MFRRGLLFLGFLVFVITGISQSYDQEFNDGKLWFRIDSENVLSEEQWSIITQNENNIPFSVFNFIDEVKALYSIRQISRPYSRAVGSELLMNTFLIEFSEHEKIDQLFDKIASDSRVSLVEKLPIRKEYITPNDQHFSLCWSLDKVQAEQAWDLTLGDSNIVVAAIEGAISIEHEDLENILWINADEIPGNGVDDDQNGYVDDYNGYDVGDNDPDPNPNVSNWDHGTHVSGIMAAETNNTIGMPSIGYGISLMAVKSTPNSIGAGFVTEGFDGIYFAALNGAHVINCSFGGMNSSETEEEIIQWAWNNGSVITAASGNDGINIDATPHYPSNYPNVICVASSNSSDVKAPSSNYGNIVDITAPGVSIVSTVPFNNYTSKSGTSMATPLVSGLIGLMMSYNPIISRDQILTCLYATCDNINPMNPGMSNYLGSGRINAYEAMLCLQSYASATPTIDFESNTNSTCTGIVKFTDLTSNAPYEWSWDMDGDGVEDHSEQHPTHVYDESGTYSVTLTATNFGGSGTITKTSFIEVNIDTSPSVQGVSICSGESAELISENGNNLVWYENENDEDPTYIGVNYLTNNLTQTATFYVASESFSPIESAGKPDDSGGGSNFGGNQYLVFDVYEPIEIVSVEVRAYGGAERTIEILNETGQVVFQKIVDVAATGTHRLNINAHLEPGNDYQIGVALNSLVNFHRNNTGVNYPYTTPGLLSIKRSTATDNNGLDHYYFFYDWEVKQEECESARREVVVRVDECNGFTDLSEITIYPNPNNGSFVIRIPRYSEGTLGVYNILGQMIHEESFYIEAESKEMTFSNLSYGAYLIRIEIGNEVVSRRIIITEQ